MTVKNRKRNHLSVLPLLKRKLGKVQEIKLIVLGFISIFQSTCDYIEHKTMALANPAQFLNLLSVSQTLKGEKKKRKYNSL